MTRPLCALRARPRDPLRRPRHHRVPRPAEAAGSRRLRGRSPRIRQGPPRQPAHGPADLRRCAGFFFIWFIGALRSLLGRAEGGEGRLATTAYGGGLIAVATLMVGFGLAAAAELHPAARPGNHPRPDRRLAAGPRRRRPRGRRLLRRQRPQHPAQRLPAVLAGLAGSGRRGLQRARHRRRVHRPRRLRGRRRARPLLRLRSSSSSGCWRRASCWSASSGRAAPRAPAPA